MVSGKWGGVPIPHTANAAFRTISVYMWKPLISDVWMLSSADHSHSFF